MKRVAVLLLTGSWLLGMTGCSDQRSAEAQVGSQGQAVPSEFPEVLATIGDEQITMAEIRARVGPELDKNESRYRRAQYRLVETTLEEILRDRVLEAEAKKQNLTVDQLVAAEIGGSIDPSEVEIATWYQENQSRTGGRTLDQIRAQIADHLRNERRKEAVEKLNERLHRERQVVVRLEPYQFQFNNEGAPSRGPADAEVTLVEFSDFQCPFCARFFSTLKRVEQNFGDRVRIVYRQYPIVSLHPQAWKAAEASLCAHDQGRFWELHDLMFQDQKRLSVSELKLAAKRVGLDQKEFDLCLDSGKYAERVQEDLNEGGRAGVNGTPALFINGVAVEGGAVPYDQIAQAIRKELDGSGR